MRRAGMFIPPWESTPRLWPTGIKWCSYNLTPPLLRAFRFTPSPFCQIAGHHGSNQEGEQCDPVLRIGDGECADRRKKKEIERGGRDDCHHQRIAQAPVRRGQQHHHEEHQCDGGLIDVKPKCHGRNDRDCGDYDCVAYRLRLACRFHTRIVRRT